MKFISISIIISLIQLASVSSYYVPGTNLDPSSKYNQERMREMIERYYKNQANKKHRNNSNPGNESGNQSDDLPNIVGMTLVRKGQEGNIYPNGYPETSLPEPYRVIAPGDAVTMDYNPSRLNVYINENNRITKVERG